MYLQGYKILFCTLKWTLVVLGFCMHVLEVIVDFVFSVTGASGVGIGNCDGWKVGSESCPLTMTRISCVHI